MHRFSFLTPLNLIVHDYGERIDDGSLMDHLEAVYGHAWFRADMDVLSSFARTRHMEVTAEGLREIARIFSGRAGPASVASLVAVVAPTRLGRGLARLYGAHADRGGEVRVEIFQSVPAAADWLDGARSRPPGTAAAAVVPLLDAVDGSQD